MGLIAEDKRQQALLLLGPTGAGKTPLGQTLEQRGLNGRRCAHFDFGESLRAVVARNEPDSYIAREEIDFLRAILDSGALLEDDRFPIVERLLRSFLARRSVDASDYLVLNGMPRHAGQARLLETIVNVSTVVCLICPAEAVIQRIRTNIGGDRAERQDDDFESVRRKLEIYARRTAPLLDHYQQRGTRVVEIEVAEVSTAEDVYTVLCRECPP